MSQQSNFKTLLERKGYRQVQSRTSKFTVMEKPGALQRIFLGPCGSVRVGTNLTGSVAAFKLREQLLALCRQEGWVK